MDGADELLIAVAGLGAGILTSTVGVASLLSFPILLAIGLPPVVANVSNTLGLVPAGIGGTFGFRRELSTQPRLALRVVILAGIAGSLGAVLLLALPPGVFESVVPWLILGSCILVGIQPRLSAWLTARRGEPQQSARTTLSPLTALFVVLTGVYGGYFGAGAGVMMVAILALGLDVDFRVISAVRTTSVMASNVVAGAIFAVLASVDWPVVTLLAIGSICGGYLGARIARRLSATVLRLTVILAGCAAAVTLLI